MQPDAIRLLTVHCTMKKIQLFLQFYLPSLVGTKYLSVMATIKIKIFGKVKCKLLLGNIQSIWLSLNHGKLTFRKWNYGIRNYGIFRCLGIIFPWFSSLQNSNLRNYTEKYINIFQLLTFFLSIHKNSIFMYIKIVYLYVNYYKIHQKYIFNYQVHIKNNFGNSVVKYTEFPKFYGILISI